MSFADMKLMYKLASQKISFNLSYMILVQMINGFKKGYMLYGLLLTKVFEYFKLIVNQMPKFEVSSTIYDQVKRVVIPLPGLTGPHALALGSSGAKNATHSPSTPVINPDPTFHVPLEPNSSYDFEK